MNEQRPIRLMVADDHPIVREGVIAVLNRQPDMRVVAEATTSREAIERFRAHQPDLVLIDLHMPEEGGVAAIQAIRQEAPDARLIVLTTFEGDENIHQAVQAGAKAYLLKTAPMEALLMAIRTVHGGRAFFPPEIASQLAGCLSRPHLTPREQEVLEWMARGKSNQEIGHSLFISEGTVKAHVNSILNKLQVSGRTQAVTTALKRGMVQMT